MTRSGSSTTCKPLLHKLEILTVPSRYILSLMRFVSTIQKLTNLILQFTAQTQDKIKLQKPSIKLTCIRKCLLLQYQNIQYTSRISLKQQMFFNTSGKKN